MKPENGELIINELTLAPNMSVEILKNQTNDQPLILVNENNGHILYRLSDLENAEASLLVMFYQDKLSKLILGLGTRHAEVSYEITENQRRNVTAMLETLGGQKIYTWGEVKYIEDTKGGFAAISISYNT